MVVKRYEARDKVKMAPGINLLRKSLRSNANLRFDDNWHRIQPKPNATESTISSLTCSVAGSGPSASRSSGSPGADTDVIKRLTSRDYTLDTVLDSVDMKCSLGSDSDSGGSPVRRLSSGSSSGRSKSVKTEENAPIRRMGSIQDEILNEGKALDLAKQEEPGSIDTSVSSLTLGSDFKLNRKSSQPPMSPYTRAKAKSFGGTDTAPPRRTHNVPSVRRTRSISHDRTKTSTSDSASGSNPAPPSLTLTELQSSLDRIREETSRRDSAGVTASSDSSDTGSRAHGEAPQRSLTLTELQTSSEYTRGETSDRGRSTVVHRQSSDSSQSMSSSQRRTIRTRLSASVISHGSGEVDNTGSDHGSVQSGYARQRNLSLERSRNRSRSRSRHSYRRHNSFDESSVHTNQNSICSSTFVRNQHKVQTLQHILNESEQSTSSTDSYLTSKSETLELLSSLHETNLLNESTILKLQHQLNEMANERDAFRTNSERVMQVMSSQNADLKSQLKKERRGFANMSFVHKKELKEWMDKASMLSTKILDMEKRACAREQDDELRSEKIINLERDIARLMDMYSKKNERKDSDKDEQKQGSPVSSSSSLQDSTERCLEDMGAHYETQLKQQRSHIEMMDLEVKCWKEKHDRMEKLYDELVSKSTGQCEELELEVKHCKAIIERMEKEKPIVRSDSTDTSVSICNDELLNKICEMVDENTLLVDKCHELENALKRCKLESQQELEASKVALQSSIRDLIKDLKGAKEENAASLAMIEALRSENSQLLASSTGKGEKKEKIRNLVRHMRSSITSSTASVATDVDEVDATDEKEETHMSEEEHKEALSVIEEMEQENDILRKSMKQAMALASDMNKRMIDFVESHEATVVTYQEQVESMRNELRREKLSYESLSKELDQLKKENDKMNSSVRQANGMVETAEELVGNLTSKNTALEDALNTERNAVLFLREEVKSVSSERDKSKDACDALQKEIETLRSSLQGLERQASDATSVKHEDLSHLRELNEKLTRELEEKKEALKLVKSALDSLKSEQRTIKETVVALRQENARLRDGEEADDQGPSTPSQQKPILRPLSNLSPKNVKELTDFEARLDKLERENRGLKEANASLSAKLFDEMEKTDGLQVANEGLAARICKLVTFIKQNQASAASKTN
ncbi:hypothetical protein HJC23_008996 [Cyclotella cryptica]|uniref:Uncharacterized protein n=1 Tax=Cyclotella cryptica TaxID=29204 RepID=A0ABD3QZ24_9STRA|eukprot:CCRYP_000586-RA/>CCRYP_000586-RA protein AED:0.03 eAED:0.03 QI:483/1/1/1/0/0/2/119/1157